MASCEVPRFHFFPGGGLLLEHSFGIRTARVEIATGGWIGWVWNLSLELDPLPYDIGVR
jgi:hypothetical protein